MLQLWIECFKKLKAFNGDISTWDTKNVSDMADMFSGQRHLTKTYRGWNVDNVSTMKKTKLTAKFKLVSQKLRIANSHAKNLIIQIQVEYIKSLNKSS